MAKKILGVAFALFSTFIFNNAVQAHSLMAGDIMVMDAWVRASPSAKVKTGAGFFTLHNTGAEGDRLIGVTSTLAKKTEMHKSSMDANGVMSMEKQDFVAIPAGERVKFKPSGLHVMFMKLKGPLEMGTNVKIELVFEKGGSIIVDLPVVKAGATSMDHSSH